MAAEMQTGLVDSMTIDPERTDVAELTESHIEQGHHDQLHPSFLWLLSGAVVWVVAMAWLFWVRSDGDSYGVTPIALIAVGAITLGLFFSMRHLAFADRAKRLSSEHASQETLGHWLEGDFDIQSERAPATTVATNLLLPLMVAPVLLTLLVIVFLIMAPAA